MIERSLTDFSNVLRVVLGVLMTSLAIPVGMQVLSRYTGVIPTYLWTEELATFIFVWIVMIGAMLAVWDGTHFDVQVTPDAERPFLKFLQEGTVLVFTIIFAVVFAWYGVEYAKVGSIQHSVMMRANMVWIYASVPIAGLVWGVFASYRLYEAFAEYRQAHRIAS